MSTTVASGAENVDLTGARPSLFDEAQLSDTESWYTVILGDLMPDWGEGKTKSEAIADLVGSLDQIHTNLHGLPDERLAEHLRYQRDFLCALARTLGTHS